MEEKYQICTDCNKSKLIEDFEGCKRCKACREHDRNFNKRFVDKVNNFNANNQDLMICYKCRKIKLLEEFDGYKSCRDCRSKIISKYENGGINRRRQSREKGIIKELYGDTKRRSKLNNFEFDLTLEYFESIFPKNNICPIRNIEMHVGSRYNRDNSFSVDRIDNNKGYVIGNIQIISFKANFIKNNDTLSELELFKNIKLPNQHPIDDITRKIILEDRIEAVKNINNFVKGIHFTKIKNNMLNVEKCMLSKSKKRAKEQNLLYNLDEDYIKSIFPLDNCCPVFGIKFIYADKMKTASLDKIIPELGYVKGNVQILSKKANTIKSNYTIQELIEVIDCFRSYYNKTGTGIIL